MRFDLNKSHDPAANGTWHSENGFGRPVQIRQVLIPHGLSLRTTAPGKRPRPVLNQSGPGLDVGIYERSITARPANRRHRRSGLLDHGTLGTPVHSGRPSRRQ